MSPLYISKTSDRTVRMKNAMKGFKWGPWTLNKYREWHYEEWEVIKDAKAHWEWIVNQLRKRRLQRAHFHGWFIPNWRCNELRDHYGVVDMSPLCAWYKEDPVAFGGPDNDCWNCPFYSEEKAGFGNLQVCEHMHSLIKISASYRIPKGWRGQAIAALERTISELDKAWEEKVAKTWLQAYQDSLKEAIGRF